MPTATSEDQGAFLFAETQSQSHTSIYRIIPVMPDSSPSLVLADQGSPDTAMAMGPLKEQLGALSTCLLFIFKKIQVVVGFSCQTL